MACLTNEKIASLNPIMDYFEADLNQLVAAR